MILYINKVNTMPTNCKAEKCKRQAKYNYLNNAIKLYCNEHKKPNMVNIDDLCKYTDCSKSASYNYENMRQKYCEEHKKERMINVKNVKCKLCNVCASFGHKNTGIEYCIIHKEKNMINLKNLIKNKKCYKCNIRSSFGFINSDNKIMSCKEHIINGMVNIKINKNIIV
jgi:hypothetical protein